MMFRRIDPKGKECPVACEQVTGYGVRGGLDVSETRQVSCPCQEPETRIRDRSVTIPTELLLFLAAFRLPTISVHPSNHHISQESTQQFSRCYGRTDGQYMTKQTVAFLEISVADLPKYQPPEPRAGHTAAKFLNYSDFLIMNTDFAAAVTTNSQRLFLQHLQSIHIFDTTAL